MEQHLRVRGAARRARSSGGGAAVRPLLLRAVGTSAIGWRRSRATRLRSVREQSQKCCRHNRRKECAGRACWREVRTSNQRLLLWIDELPSRGILRPPNRDRLRQMKNWLEAGLDSNLDPVVQRQREIVLGHGMLRDFVGVATRLRQLISHAFPAPVCREKQAHMLLARDLASVNRQNFSARGLSRLTSGDSSVSLFQRFGIYKSTRDAETGNPGMSLT